MVTSLTFTDAATAARAPTLVVIGRKERLAAADVAQLLPEDVGAAWSALLEDLSPGDKGASSGTWRGSESPRQVIAAALPESCSRHNAPGRPDAIHRLLKPLAKTKGDVGVILAIDDGEHGFAAGCAVARAFPLYSAKRETSGPDEVRIAFLPAKGGVADGEILRSSVSAIRRCARLVDMPTSELHTDAFVAEARKLAARNDGVTIDVIRGKDLDKRGFGGLWGVGKAATRPPALVVLSYKPEDAKRTLAWVGKGIVYDTGGLSIKGKAHMPGMKGDMGGAAAVIAAFEAAVQAGIRDNLHALLCIAENSVGPESVRPDDILTMYSKRTVEVNNTDAEGRLVLADGVAYAAEALNPDIIVDVATLTGAQLVATGKLHAGVVCNDDDLEAAVIRAGKRSGDLVHALPYCPEFFRSEFKSGVADMKNSVKDRMNAQSSCAAQFVAEHLGDFKGPWLHLDIAGPAGTDDQRGTGFGVALLMELFVSQAAS